MRFFARTTLKVMRIGILSGSTPTPSPLGLSQTLKGLILARPYDLIACRCRSSGFGPSRLFPSAEPYQPRRLAIPSRRFCSVIRRLQNPHPQGFVSCERPLPTGEYCIPCQPVSFLGFPTSTAFCNSGWRCLSTTHPLMTFPVPTLHAESRRWPSASSPRTTRHLPLSRAPTVLVSLGLPSTSTRRRLLLGVGPGPAPPFPAALSGFLQSITRAKS